MFVLMGGWPRVGYFFFCFSVSGWMPEVGGFISVRCAYYSEQRWSLPTIPSPYPCCRSSAQPMN